FSAVASQCFVDGVVQHLENKVMQTGAVGGVADIHAGALAHRFQAFQDLDGGGAVLGRLRGLLRLVGFFERKCRHGYLLKERVLLKKQSGSGALTTLAGALLMTQGRKPGPSLLGRMRPYIRIGMTTYLKSALSGIVIKADELASPKAM